MITLTLPTLFFCPDPKSFYYTIKQRWRGLVMRLLAFGWVSKRMRTSVCACVCPSRSALWALHVQFSFDHIQTSHVSCSRRKGTLLILGHGVKGQLWPLSIKLCRHDPDCSFSPIIFKLQMWFMDDKRRNPIELGSRGKRSWSTLVL